MHYYKYYDITDISVRHVMSLILLHNMNTIKNLIIK